MNKMNKVILTIALLFTLVSCGCSFDGYITSAGVDKANEVCSKLGGFTRIKFNSYHSGIISYKVTCKENELTTFFEINTKREK